VAKVTVTAISFPQINWDAVNAASQVYLNQHFTRRLDDAGINTKDCKASLFLGKSHVFVSFVVHAKADAIVEVSSGLYSTSLGLTNDDYSVVHLTGNLAQFEALIRNINGFSYNARLIVSGIIEAFRQASMSELWKDTALHITKDGTYEIKSR